MPRLARIAVWCTAPRVVLLAAAAVVSMLTLILAAEIPMASALQVAVALEKAGKPAPPFPQCATAGLAERSSPLTSFDGRDCGYTVPEALQILCAMEADGGAGKDAYLNRHFPLDVLFPLLYGPAIAALYLYLLHAYGWHKSLLRYLTLLPLLGGLLDLAENLVVRTLVAAGPPPDPARVEIASMITVAKYALVNFSFLVTFAFLLWFLIRGSLRPSSAQNGA
jgi:hypothetical protein